MTKTEEIMKLIEDDTESLETTEGDSVECISVENLEGILKRHFKEE